MFRYYKINESMNNYIYTNFIISYLPVENIKIVSRSLMYLMGLKKRERFKKHYLGILVHAGTPCHRYCVCKLMNEDDVNYLFKHYYY